MIPIKRAIPKEKAKNGLHAKAIDFAKVIV